MLYYNNQWPKSSQLSNPCFIIVTATRVSFWINSTTIKATSSQFPTPMETSSSIPQEIKKIDNQSSSMTVKKQISPNMQS